MLAERPAPKKEPKRARPRKELSELVRCIEEGRLLPAEVAQLVCELQRLVTQVRQMQRGRVL